ncbi:uncharacterized protein LOC125235176 [Leguminivora glycinivorella]|uniref:uncharacterized protein LOC125235176 n=1 Tax=Leguminivora glycinivorella TaxID=1035111 RepID=UPI00200D3FC6|nr:uncharacterized protein LOC125235176 [Leguminivora glycinivorella]
MSFCSRDLCAIKLHGAQNSSLKEMVVASVYMPEADDPPPHDLTRLVNYCEEEGLELIVATDSNAHHPLWGMTTGNERDSPLCRACTEAEETAAHVILECPGVAEYRAQHLGSPGCLPEVVGNIKGLLGFLVELGWQE